MPKQASDEKLLNDGILARLRIANPSLFAAGLVHGDAAAALAASSGE